MVFSVGNHRLGCVLFKIVSNWSTKKNEEHLNNCKVRAQCFFLVRWFPIDNVTHNVIKLVAIKNILCCDFYWAICFFVHIEYDQRLRTRISLWLLCEWTNGSKNSHIHINFNISTAKLLNAFELNINEVSWCNTTKYGS